jgi:cell division protein FtsL
VPNCDFLKRLPMLKKLLIKVNNVKVLKLICLISFLAMAGSFVAQMYYSSKLAVKSGELVVLTEKKQDLQKEIAILELEDSYLSSLSYVEEKARLFGFIEMQDPILAVKPAPTASAVVPVSN